MSKEHEHNFVAERYTVQESRSMYMGNYKYQTAILDIEKVLLFCTKCGEKIEEATQNKE